MYLLFAEMLLALAIIVFIMWWTMKDAVKSDQHANAQRTSVKPEDAASNTVSDAASVVISNDASVSDRSKPPSNPNTTAKNSPSDVAK